jgi:protocatechuate 3,4-dioxygenase beta subunit
MDSSCQPVPGTWLDFWQAESQANYDNQGFTLRGHQFTDDNGHYALETIVPGFYPGRTEHIHVKVQAPDGPILTTQLFFPDVSSNNTDAIFDSGLVIQITSQTDTEIKAEFTFIVPVK